VKEYLNRRPRRARYAAALMAVETTMHTWEQWALGLGAECPNRILKAPSLAKRGVEDWVAGEISIEHLCELAVAADDAWRFADERGDLESQLATLASATALTVISVAVEEATGEQMGDGTLHLADAVLAAAAVTDELGTMSEDGFLAVWIGMVEQQWPETN
jgi:hypothetical protein